MSECVAPSAQLWRDRVDEWDDDFTQQELERAWVTGNGFTTSGRPFEGPPYEHMHHDWTNFRAATLREARKRGLDISITGL